MPSFIELPRPSKAEILPIQAFRPDLHERAWQSIPHPTLPLLATAHSKCVTVFSLATFSSHSALAGGHTRSVRTVAWKTGLPPHKLCLVSGSFDATAGLWRWDGDSPDEQSILETEISMAGLRSGNEGSNGSSDNDSITGPADKDWEFTLVLEGHDSEIKCCTFSPSGAYLATCSRDKSVWIWEDIGATEADDEWETVAVLNEHDGDVKAVAWCPDVPGRNRRRQYSADVLASASYDNTVRIWREDGDGEWVCVAVLEGHEGTVWGIEWEQKPAGDEFPRLLSFSADGTTRVWTLKEEQDDEDGVNGDVNAASGRSALGGIPNTMRRSLREEWACSAVLPRAHDRDVYSATWSAETGMVATTGRDGKIVLYREPDASHTNGGAETDTVVSNGREGESAGTWELLTTISNAHGPFEVNHITWCKRYDAEAEHRGEEEMLVTTGDDGVVRSWSVKITNLQSSIVS